MEGQDSLCCDSFEAGGVDGVLLDDGVDCAEDQQFRKDAEFVGVASTVSPQVSRGVVIVNGPLVSSGCDDFGRFCIGLQLLRKFPILSGDAGSFWLDLACMRS